ncbi:MAG: ABC transporter ATP-binding protein [Odoribacter sp.]|nr:ABC transporter ATP-binding protein [Odoribacter sp.]
MALSAIDLTVGYGSRAVLAGINASVSCGSLTALVGANGCGKSTLLRTLAGNQPPLAGHVLLEGEDITRLRAAALARRLSIVLTDRTGGGGLTVAQVVAVGRHLYSGFMGRLSQDDRIAVDNAINAVGLERKRDDFMASLSDGERQKVMIARAMAQSTDVMILDEPTSFLDVAARFDIMRLLRRIASAGTAVLLSTHDIAPALDACDTIWAVAAGKLHTGSRDAVIASGVLDNVYPGAVFDSTRLDFKPAP